APGSTSGWLRPGRAPRRYHGDRHAPAPPWHRLLPDGRPGSTDAHLRRDCRADLQDMPRRAAPWRWGRPPDWPAAEARYPGCGWQVADSLAGRPGPEFASRHSGPG